MTQARATDRPVRVRIRRGKLLALGLGNAFFCIVLFEVGFLNASFSDGWSFMSKLCAGLILVLVPVAVFLIGLAVRNPVALRMDRDGISGFFTAPARWSEIDRIDLRPGPKETMYLGFRLKDPISFRDRQTPMQRLISWMNGKTEGFHILISDSVLAQANMRDLLMQAWAFQDASTNTPPPHRDVT